MERENGEYMKRDRGRVRKMYKQMLKLREQQALADLRADMKSWHDSSSLNFSPTWEAKDATRLSAAIIVYSGTPFFF